jgi:hypothetical protein
MRPTNLLGIGNIAVRLDRDNRELLNLERMLKVKPFPAECPFDGLELFGAAEELNLQPSPSRPVTATLQRLYRQLLDGGAVLEHVCDGQTRLPWLQRTTAKSITQLHACAGSFAAASRGK